MKKWQTKRSEIGAIKKDWGGKLPVAIIYPNTYHVGMSNLALHLLYQFFNDDPQIVAERVFLSEEGKATSVESNRIVSDFHIAAFTFSFEADYLNIKKILGKTIPLLREDRSETHPLLFAGGPAVTMNPQALSKIFDVIIIGEVEMVIDSIISACKESETREVLLEKLSTLDGVFVPAIHASPKTKRILVADLDRHPTHSVIWTDDTEFGHMHLVEVSRGCPWKCSFCATPPIYNPYRVRSGDIIRKSIAYGRPHRNHIGLIGADILSHPDVIGIVSDLVSEKVGVSFSSVRASRINKEIATLLARSGHRRMTLGIEAGSESLRKKIEKGLTDEQIVAAVQHLAHSGITQLKLYFLIGIPDETDDDVLQIGARVSEIREILLKDRKESTMAPDVTVVTTPFVPKLQTPLAEAPFAGSTELKRKLRLLRGTIGKIPNTTMAGDSPKHADLEYRLSHADPDLIPTLLK